MLVNDSHEHSLHSGGLVPAISQYQLIICAMIDATFEDNLGIQYKLTNKISEDKLHKCGSYSTISFIVDKQWIDTNSMKKILPVKKYLKDSQQNFGHYRYEWVKGWPAVQILSYLSSFSWRFLASSPISY